jgi:hypothetical protein
MQQMSKTDLEAQFHEFSLIETFDKIRKKLFPVSDRNSKLQEELSPITITDDLYVPSNLELKIHGIDISSSRTLKSKARVPILV